MSCVLYTLPYRHASVSFSSSFSSSTSLLGGPLPTAYAPSRIHSLAVQLRCSRAPSQAGPSHRGDIFLSAHVPSPGVCPVAPEASTLPPGALFLLALPGCSAQPSTTPDVCSTQVSTLPGGCTGLHQVTVCSLVFARVMGPKGNETAK